MRNKSIRELLLLLFDNQDLFKYGLCSWSFYLYKKKLITKSEYNKLMIFIKNNAPKKTFWKYLTTEQTGKKSRYYWKMGSITPRLKWLNEKLEQYG